MRAVLYGFLLVVVAAAAAVMSFAASRDLARLCGFSTDLAWLLPVVVDAGAAAGSLVWLGGQAPPAAQRFARALALGLLSLSVVANALGHGLEAYGLAPPWWVVVAVSAIAPAVLGAVVHLAVVVGRRPPEPSVPHRPELPLPDLEFDGTADLDDDLFDECGVSRFWADAPPAVGSNGDQRAAALIAAGVGRRRLARELGMSEYEARLLLEQSKQRDGGATEGDGDQG